MNNDECIICFKSLKNTSTYTCKICKTSVHKECYENWQNFKKDNKCIYCMNINIINKKKLITPGCLHKFCIIL